MKRIDLLFSFLLVAFTLMLASCSDGDSFKIDGTLTGVEGAMVRIVFEGDSGIVDEWADVDKKGHFSFKGQSALPVMVNILNPQNDLLLTVVTVNGDHLKLKGDASKVMAIKVKGNKLNEDWQLFRDEHQAFYTDPNPSRLDAAIEKYVREHPADMLSTALLMADYSDYSNADKVKKLLEGIEPQARPESLTRSFLNNPMRKKSGNLPRLMTLTLAKPGGAFEEIKLTDQVTLISLWANPQNDRMTALRALNEAGEENTDRFHVIDVLTEADTLRWHQTIAGDPKEWKHYWAPGGPLEQGIQLLGITSLPWFAVTDSTGMVTYNGPDLNAALEAAALH